MSTDGLRASMLVDGELEASSTGEALLRFADDAELRGRWLAYHMIGDALRAQNAEPIDDLRFLRRLAERLDSEPIHLPSADHRAAPSAANAARVRPAVRKVGLSLLAAAAAVAGVTWISSLRGVGVAPDAPAVTAAALPVPQIERYVLAHQQYAPGTRLQGGGLYVRTAAWGRPRQGDSDAGAR